MRPADWASRRDPCAARRGSSSSRTRRVLPAPGSLRPAAGQGIVRVGRQHDGIERVAGAGRRSDRDVVGGPIDGDDRVAGTHRLATEPLEDPLHVGHGAARDRPPLQGPSHTDQAVVIEEAQEVVDRELEDPIRCGRPDRGRDRDQEVIPECPRRIACRQGSRRGSRVRSCCRRVARAHRDRTAGCRRTSANGPVGVRRTVSPSSRAPRGS